MTFHKKPERHWSLYCLKIHQNIIIQNLQKFSGSPVDQIYNWFQTYLVSVIRVKDDVRINCMFYVISTPARGSNCSVCLEHVA